ncbi:MAG: type 4a pilus biogenesis protein PilO [Candidatus Omnitrophota bacterium]
MNLKELSQLDVKDLKNIDYRAVLGGIRKNPFPAVNTVIVLAAIAVCFVIVISQGEQRKALKAELRTVEKKLDEYQTYQELKAEYERHVAQFPPEMGETELIKMVTRMAGTYGISIESFPPMKELRTELYNEFSFTLTIIAPGYEQLWRFMLELETADGALRIDEWSTSAGQPRSRRRGRRQPFSEEDNEDMQFQSRMKMTYVNFVPQS